MYRLKVKLQESPLQYGYDEEMIIKFFQSDVERRAYLNGLRAAAEFAGFDIIDLEDQERRKQWCQEQGTLTSTTPD